MVNEFNYMHDLYTNINEKLLMQKTGGYNWASLFTQYDSNKDNLLDKTELKNLMKESGMAEVTDAEVGFAFNIMANFKKHINKSVFLDWI